MYKCVLVFGFQLISVFMIYFSVFNTIAPGEDREALAIWEVRNRAASIINMVPTF